MDKGAIQPVIAQMEVVQAKHPTLALAQEHDGSLRVHGPLGFTVEHEGNVVSDIYQIDIHIPDDYPDSHPSVYETEGRVPKEFGHFMNAGNFCLGARVDVQMRFARNPTLLGFIDELVVPYLFSNSYKREYGEMPYGEYAHGSLGLIQHYKSYFNVEMAPALRLLKCLADQFAPPLGACPCGSGQLLKDCHGPKLDELRPHLSAKWFETELREIVTGSKKAGLDLSYEDVMPKRMWKQHQSRLRKQAKIKKKGR